MPPLLPGSPAPSPAGHPAGPCAPEALAVRLGAVKTSSGAKLDAARVLVLGLALAAGVFFWDSPALWPLKLFVVAVHESGHALATWAVGGSVQRILLARDESGACLSRLPPSLFGQVLVYSAGYVGSAMAGGLMLIATFRFRLQRAVLWAACLWLGALALLLAGNAFTLLFCLGTALALGLCARFLPAAAVDVINLFMAAFTALYVVFDLRDDLWDGATRKVSDAALLAQVTWIPAMAWAAVWTLFSLAALFAAGRISVHRPRAPRLELPPPGQRRGRIR